MSTARTIAAYGRMRTKMGSVSVRHKGQVYTCPAQSLQSMYDGAGMVMVEGATGAVRILVSEMNLEFPKAGDDLQIKDPITTLWDDYTILDASTENAGVTMLVQYGGRYGP